MISRISFLMLGAALLAISPVEYGFAQSVGSSDTDLIERGRYLVKIAGCNDCHTPGYVQTGGMVPEELWLTGDRLGWHGAWGTTYPANLRLYMQGVSVEEWIQNARTRQLRPPMPWFALRDMTETDLRAIYSLVRYLGPAGEPVPAYVPPEQEPVGPLVRFPVGSQ
ncbi:cytochrome C [Oceanisphaera arctica]|nr:cytochrome C [Oceanisphaera arctica]